MTNLELAFINLISAINSLTLSEENKKTFEALKKILIKRGYGYIPTDKLLVEPPDSIKAALKKAGRTYE